MYKDQKLDDNGIEICLFPMEVLNCTQGAGFTVNNTIDYGSYSHCGAYAYDMMGQDAGIDPAYAPVSVKVRKIENQEVGYGNRTWFSSIDKVKFPDGEIAYLHMYMVHCDDENMGHLAEDDSFAQGDIIYYEGTKGIGTGNHIHIEAMRSQSYTLPSLTRIKEYDNTEWEGVVKMVGAEPIQKIFYLNGTVTNANKAGTKFADKTFTDVPHINGIPEFIEYTVGPFNPSNKNDGWYKHNGTWYYVENHVCITGWKKIDTSWFYFETDGKMKTGWVASGNDWYWLSPTSGVMQINSFVDNDRYYVDADGKMLRSGWTLINGEYYYFKDEKRDIASKFSPFTDGEKVTNVWIASGSSWYYMLSDGKMAKNCQIKENGKYYAFNNSGACLNASGQSSQYNTTTYPMKS